MPGMFRRAAGDRGLASGTGNAKWVRRGETVDVGGFRLFVGLFYLGRSFGPENSAHDNYILNPNFTIGHSSNTPFVTNEWVVSYTDMSPETRRGYLEWLSGGCRNKAVPLYFMRLYMGGLYYRVLVDQGDDTEVVVTEARRISRLYSESFWCRETAASLVVWATGIGYQRGQRPVPSEEWAHSIHVPLSVSLRIAHLISQGAAVDGEDAFLWASQRGKVKYPSQGSVADDGTRLLWLKAFARRYPNGLTCADVPRQRIKPLVTMPDGVRPVAVPVPEWCLKLPDPAQAVAFDDALGVLYAECQAEMRAYNKHLKKAGGGDVSLAAMSALPKQLVATSLAGRFGRVKETLDGALARGPVVSKVENVFQVMGIPFERETELTPGVIKMIGLALDKLDIAFEPDRRYGGAGFSNSGSMVFFRGEDGLPVSPTEEYVAHQAAADFLVGQLCANDGDVAFVERSMFDIRRAGNGFSDAERVRLGAYTRSVGANRNAGKQKGAKLSRLDEDGKALLVEILATVVAAWAGLSPSSVGKAEKFIGKLGGDPRNLHVAMHRRTAAADAPVSVIGAQPGKGFSIPKDREKTGPALDMARLGQLEADTALVSGILSDIFAETAEEAPAVVSGSADGTFKGLDVGHSAILEGIMSAGSMSRGEFETLARSSGCLPDGALETVNEWAFESLGAAILVELDDIMLEDYLRADLEKTRTFA